MASIAQLYVHTAAAKDTPGATILVAAHSRGEAELIAAQYFNTPPTNIRMRTYRLPGTNEQLIVHSVPRVKVEVAAQLCDQEIDGLPPCTNKPMRNWTTCSAHRSFGRSTVSDERGGNYTPPRKPRRATRKRAAS
jgi:hypothetical protein